MGADFAPKKAETVKASWRKVAGQLRPTGSKLI